MRVRPWHVAHRSAVKGNKGQNECSIICPAINSTWHQSWCKDAVLLIFSGKIAGKPDCHHHQLAVQLPICSVHVIKITPVF